MHQIQFTYNGQVFTGSARIDLFEGNNYPFSVTATLYLNGNRFIVMATLCCNPTTIFKTGGTDNDYTNNPNFLLALGDEVCRLINRLENEVQFFDPKKP